MRWISTALTLALIALAIHACVYSNAYHNRHPRFRPSFFTLKPYR